MTRHRLPATLWNSPELSTPDEPEPPREKAWWVDEQDDEFTEYEADGGDCAPWIGNER